MADVVLTVAAKQPPCFWSAPEDPELPHKMCTMKKNSIVDVVEAQKTEMLVSFFLAIFFFHYTTLFPFPRTLFSKSQKFCFVCIANRRKEQIVKKNTPKKFKNQRTKTADIVHFLNI